MKAAAVASASEPAGEVKDLPKATVKLQSPAGASPAGPRPASVPAPKATVPLAKSPVPEKNAPAEVGGVPARGGAPAMLELDEADEEQDQVQASGAGGMDKWLAIAASIVALLSTVSTFLAYSSIK